MSTDTSIINPDIVGSVVEHVYRTVPIPIIIKVGIFDTKQEMEIILHRVAAVGARGICGINSIPVKIVTPEGDPFFGTSRITSGLSGASIRNLAKQFIADALDIIKRGNLDLVLLATGGITKAEHFQEFLTLGADVALSATGTMWNPFLAIDYYRSTQKIN